MDEALLAELRERLQAMKRELQATLSETVELEAMAQAQHRRTDQQLKTVINALARIETERYGECLRCSDEVGLERLLAKPETPFCLECASS